MLKSRWLAETLLHCLKRAMQQQLGRPCKGSAQGTGSTCGGQEQLSQVAMIRFVWYRNLHRGLFSEAASNWICLAGSSCWSQQHRALCSHYKHSC